MLIRLKVEKVKANKYLGELGEEIACKYIQSKGMLLLQKNFSCKAGEIDIIAKDKENIVFIEVKTRTSDKYGKPSEAVSIAKQRKIVKTALWYMSQKHLFDYMSRFDVIELLQDSEAALFKINYIKDAFQYSGRYGY